MEFAGPTAGKATAPRFQALTNHRKLIATTFPWSASKRMIDAGGVTNEDRREMFHCAASQGALFSVLKLLAGGRFSKDLTDRFGRTPLHWAAEQGHRNVVLALLRAGADVDPRSQRKATPIMLAAARGHAQIVRLLLQYRAGESDCNGIGHPRVTALHCAAAGGHVGVVRLLLDAGFDKGQHDREGLTPVEISARQSRSTTPAVTQLLLPSDKGGKLVYECVNNMGKDAAILPGLISGGAFLDWQDIIGDSTLQTAVRFYRLDIVRILLRAGADPNLSDHLGACPLHAAARNGRDEIIADLLEAGADTERTTMRGESPLQQAVVSDCVNGVKLLLNAGASIEHRDNIHGQTPLSWACRGCLAHIVRVLVEAGADVASRSSTGLTPLHWACRYIDAESVEVLLRAGADPGAVDQVAAAAVAASSARSNTVVSRPVAIDVIGLGYPVDLMERLRCPITDGSERLAANRMDLGSVQRIELALHVATREHAWRRRSWLILLASRIFAAKVPAIREEPESVCRVDRRPFNLEAIQLRHVDDAQRPYAHQKTAAGYRVNANTHSDSFGSQHPQADLRNGQNAFVVARATPLQQDETCGDIGGQDNRAARLWELVAALLGLAAIEVGVFRRVVTYI